MDTCNYRQVAVEWYLVSGAAEWSMLFSVRAVLSLISLELPRDVFHCTSEVNCYLSSPQATGSILVFLMAGVSSAWIWEG